jgi:DNA-binding MarR family transcriptional regulator
MAVNRVTPASAGAQDVAREKNGSADDVTRDEVREVLRLFVAVITGLKRGRDEVPDSFHEAFASGGLGPRHVPVLMTVALDGPLSVGEIAERIGLSLATTSLMVGELDRHGLVERAEDERDRRRTLVRLPEAHRAIVDRWSRERSAPVARALGQMSPAVRKHFLEGMRVLAEEARAGMVDEARAAAGDD